jgi:hypothetical protein
MEDIIETHGANATEWRPRIEHAQIMTLSDLERAGRLGGELNIVSYVMVWVWNLLMFVSVINSVQPTHA